MIRTIGMLAAFSSAIFFPWPMTACLALGMAIFEPWTPLAAGLIVEALYRPHAAGLPWFAAAGAAATAVAFFIRARLKTGIVER